MTSATLKLPNGTTVTIDGTPDEVASLLKMFSGPGTKSVGDASSTPDQSRKREAKARSPTGPTGFIKQLKAEGYFKTKRTLGEVRKKLEELGHIYAPEHLSPQLVRLVRRRVLGRVKEADGWKYVDR